MGDLSFFLTPSSADEAERAAATPSVPALAPGVAELDNGLATTAPRGRCCSCCCCCFALEIIAWFSPWPSPVTADAVIVPVAVELGSD